jgi:SIR2-like domain
VTTFQILTLDALVEQIRAKLAGEPYESRYHHYRLAPDPAKPAAYALILGAGASASVVPLVRQLMRETIGDYYIPDQDTTAMERPRSTLEQHSADFWAQLNRAAAEYELDGVLVGEDGLPVDNGAAYQYLFTYEGANALFALATGGHRRPRYAERLRRSREPTSPSMSSQPPDAGERFMKGFLGYVTDIGSEHGHGSTGRSHLNPAHIYLAALLEAQQAGLDWNTRAFCRTILTTNFDTLLQNSLQMVNLLYSMTDRPEKGLDPSDFAQETAIHLVYTHGSILRHNPAHTVTELGRLKEQNVDILRSHLESRDVITVGYSGWNDGLMAALRSCRPTAHKVYCCDTRKKPPKGIADLLTDCAEQGAYIHTTADELFRSLYETLVSRRAQRNPVQRYAQWNALRSN